MVENKPKHDAPEPVLTKLRYLIRDLDTYDVWMSSYFCALCLKNGKIDESAILAGRTKIPGKWDNRGGVYCTKHGLLAFEPLADLKDGVRPLG